MKPARMNLSKPNNLVTDLEAAIETLEEAESRGWWHGFAAGFVVAIVCWLMLRFSGCV